MRFKLVRTGKNYAEFEELVATAETEVVSTSLKRSVPPLLWNTGDIAQIRTLLLLREAELVVARAQLTGEDYFDWYVKNRIIDLEIKIADLRRWLAEAMEKRSES